MKWKCLQVLPPPLKVLPLPRKVKDDPGASTEKDVKMMINVDELNFFNARACMDISIWNNGR